MEKIDPLSTLQYDESRNHKNAPAALNPLLHFYFSSARARPTAGESEQLADRSAAQRRPFQRASHDDLNGAGEFTGVTGSVTYDPKDPARDAVEATIDCSTVNTGVAKRDAQLKTADFFDVAHYPTMKFKSKRVEKAGEGKLKVTGDLTINTTTQEVVLDVDGPTASIRDPRGNEKIGLEASTQISRKKFGIIWNETMESGGIAVADEVSISLDLELIKNAKPQ